MHSEPNVATRRGDAAMVADVQAGLVDRAPGVQRELPPKYFYDHRGSQLFEAITRLPEYYLTRTERLLLSTLMPEWMDILRPGALVELGAGNADKTRTILDAMRAARGNWLAADRAWVGGAERAGGTTEAMRGGREWRLGKLRDDHHTYKLDVRKVDPSELSAMCRVFRKMNFDSSIQLTGV